VHRLRASSFPISEASDLTFGWLLIRHLQPTGLSDYQDLTYGSGAAVRFEWLINNRLSLGLNVKHDSEPPTFSDAFLVVLRPSRKP